MAQYVAVDLDDNDLTDKASSPQTSYSENISNYEFSFTPETDTLTVSIGNDSSFSKKIFGSFKSVRLWGKARSKEDLYASRFS